MIKCCRSETVGSSDDMLDSDKTMSDESEDEEDESSMMNWVMPLIQAPTLENQNNLINNQFNKEIFKAVQEFVLCHENF